MPQVAPYERPALSKAYLFPECKHQFFSATLQDLVTTHVLVLFFLGFNSCC